MPYVYILYSTQKDKFYIGITSTSVEERYEKHLLNHYSNKFTASIKDWEVFHSIECITMEQALKIEKHLKNMKSKTYIRNLIKYPEINLRLKQRFQGNDS